MLPAYLASRIVSFYHTYRQLSSVSFSLTAPVGFEPTTHKLTVCCTTVVLQSKNYGAGTRTPTKRTKTSCATITPPRNYFSNKPCKNAHNITIPNRIPHPP